MSHRPIIDAGPGLNFFSLNKERLLFSVLGPLCLPDVVRTEILGKVRHDRRFASAARVWSKLPPRLMEVLPDEATEDLASAVARITMTPFAERIRTPRDLGEVMVTAHAVVAAERGQNVLVLIDDQDGRKLVAAEQRRLDRLRANNSALGRIELIGTLTVLKKAAGGQYLPDRAAVRGLYERMRTLDDGLPPLETTELMQLSCWQ